MPRRIALIAHDLRKDDLVSFVSSHARMVARCSLVARMRLGLIDDIMMALNRACAQIILRSKQAVATACGQSGTDKTHAQAH